MASFAAAEKAIESNLGHAAPETTLPLSAQVGWNFSVIPEGAETTIIPVAFPVDSLPKEKQARLVQEMEIFAVLGLALMIWMLPFFFINRGLCCRCFQRCLSRHLSCYFCLGLLFVVSAVSFMVAKEPDVNANDLFFKLVEVLEFFSEKLSQILMQVTLVLGILVAVLMRKKIVSLLGYDSQIVRADLKDVLTLFQAQRFSPIEVTLWKVSGLPAAFSTRTLFVRMLLGYNEPQHSRPHNGRTDSMVLRETFQLNYDPEDETQQLSIVIKQQELVGNAVSQLAPVAGALVGAAGGLVTPLGPTAGAGLGVVTGVGAANSLGVEVARVDLSSAMVNRLRNAARGAQVTDRSRLGTARHFNDENFAKVDLVPQGQLWLSIEDVAHEVP